MNVSVVGIRGTEIAYVALLIRGDVVSVFFGSSFYSSTSAGIVGLKLQGALIKIERSDFFSSSRAERRSTRYYLVAVLYRCVFSYQYSTRYM